MLCIIYIYIYHNIRGYMEKCKICNWQDGVSGIEQDDGNIIITCAECRDEHLLRMIFS